MDVKTNSTEIRAMARALSILEDITEAEAKRIVRWLAERYGIIGLGPSAPPPIPIMVKADPPMEWKG